jgi:hypothetical protein
MVTLSFRIAARTDATLSTDRQHQQPSDLVCYPKLAELNDLVLVKMGGKKARPQAVNSCGPVANPDPLHELKLAFSEGICGRPSRIRSHQSLTAFRRFGKDF